MMNCSIWFQCIFICSLFLTTFGGCLFPSDWSGRWYQYGVAGSHLVLNATNFESKGECIEVKDSKYIVSERSEKDPCRRCLAVYKRHENVIQYKESNCLPYESLEELCHDIAGDQPLLTMFRADDASAIPCPFKSPPYRFSYNRGSGECSQNSRIDSCTDDSRLLVYFAACPDVPGTESGVEELSCLGTWKEGSSLYLVARIKKDLVLQEEDSYRCFIYIQKPGSKLVYQVAQSGDATCLGVTSPTEGSKTMVLTRIESSHERCKFPSWVVSHHHWHSLDNRHSYHFSHRNATLRISREHGPTEMRLVCHHIVANSSMIALVAHTTAGCKNGYICMVFQKRDNGIIQVQQSNEMVQESSEACIPPFTESYSMSRPVTLTTVSLAAEKCPQAGQYTVVGWPEADITCHNTTLYMGCLTSPQVLTVQTCSTESSIGYHCLGSWIENGTTFLIASPVSRKSTDAKRYCFILSQKPDNGHFTLYRLTDSCNLSSNQLVSPLNLTLQGLCSENSSSKDVGSTVLPSLIIIKFAFLFISVLR